MSTAKIAKLFPKTAKGQLVLGGVLITLAFGSYIYFMTAGSKNATFPENTSFIDRLRSALDRRSENEGEIDEFAASDVRNGKGNDNVAGANSEREEPTNSQIWTATDYKQGELKTGTYTVKRGDTLWEIAEAVYGDGTQWHKILEANNDSVGFLPNGSQARIEVGQKLNLP